VGQGLSLNNSGLSGVLFYASASYYETNSIPPGGTYWRTISCGFLCEPIGAYYLVFQADTDITSSNPISTTTLFCAGNVPNSPADLGPVASRAAVRCRASQFHFHCDLGCYQRGLAPVVSDLERYDYVYLSTNAALGGFRPTHLDRGRD